MSFFFGLLVIRGMIQRVQKGEEKKFKAKMISQQVQWYFQQDDGTMVAFDLDTNLLLEEALMNKQHVKIKISNKPYHADVFQRKAVAGDNRKAVELQRQDMKGQSFCLQNPLHVHIYSYIYVKELPAPKIS